MKKAYLSFYGITVSVETSFDSILRFVEHDFSYFLTRSAAPSPAFEGGVKNCSGSTLSPRPDLGPKGNPRPSCRGVEGLISEERPVDLRIIYHYETPDYNQLPLMTSRMATPRNICFRNGTKAFIDYFGNALNIYDRKQGLCEIFTQKVELAREIIYLTILSRVSELLENKQIHRIHALGLEYQDQGILILLPSGGGKTTLALQILLSEKSDFRLLSEDSPLVMYDGTLLPFPLRIGILKEQVPPGIHPDFILPMQRMEFDPKFTVDIRWFSKKIGTRPVRPKLLLLGQRSTGNVSEICRVSRHSILKYIWMNSVVGFGLYQGMEFVMSTDLMGILKLGKRIFSRWINTIRLMARVQVYCFTIGKDLEKNLEVLQTLVKESEV